MTAPTTNHDDVLPRPTGASGSDGRRRGLLIGGAAVGLLAVAWLGLFLAAGSGVPRGTTVDGLRIGGLSEAAARARVAATFGPRAEQPVTVRVGNETEQLDPRASGLGLDPAATVEAAGTRSWNPVLLVKAFFGDHALHPVARVDEDRLHAALQKLATKTHRLPVDGSVTFTDGRVVPVEPQDGVRLDVDGAAGTLQERYLRAGGPIALPVLTESPKVGRDAVQQAVQDFADPAMSGPVTLDIAGHTVTITPRLVSPALTMKPDQKGNLQPALDVPTLRKALAGQLAGIERQGRSATFRIVSDRPVVVPARTGLQVDNAALSTAVLDALGSTDDRTRQLSLTVAQPALTTAAAQALGVVEQVSTFTTHYPSNFRPRLINIHRAADLLNGALVLPGQIFSLNARIGERTAARGFARGYIIDDGQLVVDYGGGVSQVATTTFNAAFFAGLQDVEHHPHSFYISRYPVGREATVAWGSKDLRFRNDSGHGIFITTAYTNSSITVTVWGTKRFTEVTSATGPRTDIKPFKTKYDPRPAGTTPNSCVPQDGMPGFKITVTRRLYQGSTLVGTQVFRTSYNPEARIVCGSSGPNPSPSPSPSQ